MTKKKGERGREKGRERSRGELSTNSSGNVTAFEDGYSAETSNAALYIRRTCA